jgi:hypothetical protein
VSTEKVQIVERAMNKLTTRSSLDLQAVQTAEQLLTEHAVILAPTELKRFAQAVVNAADPDGPEPIDDQLQQDRRYIEPKQRRDGMWHLNGRLASTVGAQLNAILDPLTKSRTTAIEDEDGNATEVPGRPYVQRLHNALGLKRRERRRRSSHRMTSPQVVPSRLLSSAVNSEISGSGVPSTAVIGTAPLRLLVQKAPRDLRRS